MQIFRLKGRRFSILCVMALTLLLTLHSIPVLASSSGNNDSSRLTAAAPEFRKVTSCSGTIFLYWDASSQKNGGYQISRRTGSGSWKVVGNITNHTQNAWHDTSAVPGLTYTYRIRSWCTKNGTKVYSSYDTASPVTCRPSQPLILSVKPKNKKKYDKVTWYTVSGVSGYAVYKKNSSTSGKWIRVKTVKASRKAATMSCKVLRDKKVSGTTTYKVLSYISKSSEKTYSEGIDSLSNASKKLSGKKILFIGDSITYGCGENGKTRLTYPERIRAVTGATICTKARIGSVLTSLRNYNSNCYVTLAENGKLPFKGYNIICIALGTNDYTQNVPLGSLSDTKDTTFYGAWNTMFRQIRRKNSKAKIVLITPPCRGRKGSNYSIAGYDSKNSAGYTLRDYADATKRIAKKYGALVYCSEDSEVITDSSYSYRLYDCLHPTDETYACYGSEIAAWLLKNY